jgi:Flp pilus assembly protein TadB
MKPYIALLFIIPAVIQYILGRYIRNTGYVEILKQYDDKKQYNREGLRAYVAKLMMMTGLLTIGLAIVSFVLALFFDVIIILGFLVIYAVMNINYVIRLRFSCKKFEIKE